MRRSLYIQPGIIDRRDEAISGCESWDINGSWLMEKRRLPQCGVV